MIKRNITIIGQSQKNTIIDAGKFGQIFGNTATAEIQTMTLRNGYYVQGGAISNWGNLTLLNCTFLNNIATTNGGAIESRDVSIAGIGSLDSDAYLKVINSTFTNNTASQSKGAGGAIDFEYGTLYLLNSSFTSNYATDAGAVHVANGLIRAANTKFINNTATNDGGVLRLLLSTANISGCTFNGNTANGFGGAICGAMAQNIIANYNWLQDDAAATGIEIYSDNGAVNATLNWWGSNTVNSLWAINAVYDPWIVLNANATPNTIVNYGTTTIKTNLWYDSNNNYVYGPDYKLPDIPLILYRDNARAADTIIHNGLASTILNYGAFNSGTSLINNRVGYENFQIIVHLKNTAPTVTINKHGGTYNTSQLISFNLNEPATIYYTTNGSTPTYNSQRYYAPFKLSSSAVLKFFAIDLSGQPSVIYTEKFVIDTKAPTVVKVDPANNAKKVSKTKPITLTFSEAIKLVNNQIVLKNSSGKVISTTKVLNGKILTIIHSALANGTYTIVIPKGSVTDLVGNKIQAYSFKFTVG